MTAKSSSTKVGSDAATTAREVLSDIADSAAEGFRQGAQSGSDAAKETAPYIRQSVSRGTYTLAYCLAFGVVYGAEVVLEFLPEDGVIRQGLRDGAAAAHDMRAAQRSPGASEPSTLVTP
jgi:hypothetical protein